MPTITMTVEDRVLRVGYEFIPGRPGCGYQSRQPHETAGEGWSACEFSDDVDYLAYDTAYDAQGYSKIAKLDYHQRSFVKASCLKHHRDTSSIVPGAIESSV